MQSILIAKIEAPGLYSSDGMVKALRDQFDQVYEFNYQNVMFNEGVEGMRRRLMGMCMMYSPDVCFLHIQIPDPLNLDLIQFLSERTFVVLYTFDVKINVDWYKEYAPYVGLILFGDGETIDYLRLGGITNVDYLPSSADFDLYKPLPEGVYPEKDYGEIVFIGNNFVSNKLNFPMSEERVGMVEYMKKHFGERFKVYGLGWPGSTMLSPEQSVAAYQSCKIAVTHNNFYRKWYTSDRLWRAMGCGACTISQYYDGYYYDIPYPISQTWVNYGTLKKRCEELLENDSFRKQIAKRQYKYVVEAHSWSIQFSRLKQLIINHGYKKRVESVS